MKLHQMYRDSSCKRSSMLMLIVSFMGTMISRSKHFIIIMVVWHRDDGDRLEVCQHPTFGNSCRCSWWSTSPLLPWRPASWGIQNVCLCTHGHVCCFLWLLWRHVGKTRQRFTWLKSPTITSGSSFYLQAFKGCRGKYPDCTWDMA